MADLTGWLAYLGGAYRWNQFQNRFQSADTNIDSDSDSIDTGIDTLGIVD